SDTAATADRDAAKPGARAPSLLEALRTNGWTVWHGVALLVLTAAGVYLTWPNYGWTDLLWLARHDAESSQIMLVPIVAAWLFWVRRRRLAEVSPRFSLLAPLCLALGWGMWEYAYYESMRAAGHIA